MIRGTEQATLCRLGVVGGGRRLVGPVLGDPVGGALECGGREVGPLKVEEALEIGHRGRGPSLVVFLIVCNRDLVGEAGGCVGVGKDLSRLVEDEAGGALGVEGGVEHGVGDAALPAMNSRMRKSSAAASGGMATAGTMPVVMPTPMRDDEAVLAGLGWG